MGKDKIKTLEKAIVAMQAKIEEQIPVFKGEPLAQKVTVGTGQEMLRQNPAVAEFRALVKDYGQAIRMFAELSGSNADEAEESSLEAIRNKFKVAK
jgi:hypothetical protein